MPVTSRPLVVIPTYNEAENIDLLLNNLFAAAPGVDVLFVDDNSQDGTKEKIVRHQALNPRIHLLQRAGKLGLGTAYVAGFKWALARAYDPIVEMDADLSHDPARLPSLLEKLETFDFVVGSRYIEGGGTLNWGLMRRLLSKGGSLYARLILGLQIRDLTGGFNGWRRRTLEAIGLDDVRSEGYTFQIELKYRAVLKDCTWCELPILFVDRRAGHSKMSGHIVLEALYRVWTLRLRLAQTVTRT